MRWPWMPAEDEATKRRSREVIERLQAVATELEQTLGRLEQTINKDQQVNP